MDANARNHRRDQHPDVPKRSQSTAHSREVCGADGKIRHRYGKDDKRVTQPTDDQESSGVDTFESRYAFTGMESLPVADDDDEIVTAGVPWADVVAVKVAGPLTLFVEHADGVKGEVRFLPSHLRGVFEKLKDTEYFARVGIRHGAVSWPNEMPDLAPDNMYIHLKRDGEWVLQ